jgi:hypothetical protein
VNRFVVAALLGLGLSAARLAQACPGCSNPNLPSARSGGGVLAASEVTVALNLSGTSRQVVHSEECPEIGPICAQREEPPQLHDQQFYIAELRPIVSVGLSETFGVEVQVPIRAVSTQIVFRRLDGTAFEPDYENIHHRNETLVGFADPWLLGLGAWSLGGVTLTGRAGVGLPIGSTEEDPFARGRAGLSHQHIQFGTGTFYPVLSVDAGFTIAPVRLSAYGQAILFLYENSEEYFPGNRFMAGGAAELDLIAGLSGGVGFDVINEQPERWSGVVQQDGNVGRTDLLAGGHLSYRFGSVSTSLALKVPVYQHFIETSHDHGGEAGQLSYPAILNLAVQARFGP